MAIQAATLGGGCFWCTEAVFLEMEGVRSVVSGYSNGHAPAPTYEQVCEGRTGHAEVVRVEFDDTVLSYRDLLGVFFSIHDPTTPDRQGNDVGTQYRSIVCTHSEEQAGEARAMIRELEEAGVFDAPIVTRVEPLSNWHPAEAYHQRYFERHPNQGYCMFVVAPKVAKFRKEFMARLRR